MKSRIKWNHLKLFWMLNMFLFSFMVNWSSLLLLWKNVEPTMWLVETGNLISFDLKCVGECSKPCTSFCIYIFSPPCPFHFYICMIQVKVKLKAELYIHTFLFALYFVLFSHVERKKEKEALQILKQCLHEVMLKVFSFSQIRHPRTFHFCQIDLIQLII